MDVTIQILLLGFAIAFVMGAVATKTNFCTMGAVSDWINMNDTGRLRAWMLAMAVAILGVTVLEGFGIVEMIATMPPYRGTNFAWLGYIVGGIVFGIGMTLASGCGNKTLLRIGGGNLKSIIVFVIAGGFAYLMTKTSFYEVLFHPWVSATSLDLSTLGLAGQDLGAMLSSVIGADVANMRLIMGLIVGLVLLAFLFSAKHFRSNFDNVFGGVVIGACVVAAWYVTSSLWFYADEEEFMRWWEIADWMDEPPINVAAQSFTFINPMAEALNYLTDPMNTLLISFGVAALVGVIAGAFVYSIITKNFRIEWFASWKDFITHAIGAVLMGIGGVLAMGCTIGQGVTGVSTLALGSVLALLSIIFGSALTMKIQFYKMMYEDEATFFKAFITSLADMKLVPNRLRQLEAV